MLADSGAIWVISILLLQRPYRIMCLKIMAGFLVVQRFDDLGKCEIYKHARYIAETMSNDPKS